MKLPVPLPRWRAAGPAAERVAPLIVLGALVAATSALAATSGLSISNPWLRLIMPSRPAAGYFTLSNETSTPRKLVGASSPACGMLMLHQSLRKNGHDEMVMLKSVDVPAHGAVNFAPGGYHLMCMSPAKDVVKGRSVPITLRFADGGTLTENFPVRGATGR